MTAPTTLVVLDMAGTTVSDDGVVERAFRYALDEAGGLGHESPVGDPDEFVRRTMGQSKISVFSQLFSGDATRARRPPMAPSRPPTTGPSTGAR